MKKIILTILCAGSMLMADSFAELGLGYAKGTSSENYLTGFGSLKVIGNIGARLEYTKSISENSDIFSTQDISRYGLYATYTLPLVAGISVTPKIGMNKTDGSFTLSETLKKVTDSSTDFTFGIEFNYEYNEQLLFFVGYTDYGNELDLKNIDTSDIDTANLTFGIKIEI